MLSYKQALKKIREHSSPLKPKLLPLHESLGLVLSENIFSPESFPSFDNSAVDGYAVRMPYSGDTIPNLELSIVSLELKVIGEIAAGQCFKEILKPGEAVQIFTGAPVPKGTEAVVMQEHTERRNGSVQVLQDFRSGDNVRFCGEDFQKGYCLLKKGIELQPSHLALLAAVGYQKVLVYPPPKVSILTTGSELLEPGERLAPGKIRDSNTILLESLVKQSGAIPKSLARVGDDLEKIRFWIRKGLQHDLLIISGGVSVGKYDFVKEVLNEEGVKEIFWKVNIKPGKPLFLGKKGRTLVFGLPGNPVSVFVTFEEFVRPAVLKMLGRETRNDMIKAGRMTQEYRNGTRPHFVRVSCALRGGETIVTPLKGQGSHMIGSLAKANAILFMEPNAKVKKNQQVRVKLI